MTSSVSSYRSPSLEAAAAVADSCSKLMRGFGRVKSQLLALARGDVDWSAQLLITRLAADGPVRLSELAEKMQADPSTISRQVATLVKDGYVERRADPVDGRASLLVVTDRGAAALHRASAAAHRALPADARRLERRGLPHLRRR